MAMMSLFERPSFLSSELELPDDEPLSVDVPESPELEPPPLLEVPPLVVPVLLLWDDVSARLRENRRGE